MAAAAFCICTHSAYHVIQLGAAGIGWPMSMSDGDIPIIWQIAQFHGLRHLASISLMLQWLTRIIITVHQLMSYFDSCSYYFCSNYCIGWYTCEVNLMSINKNGHVP